MPAENSKSKKKRISCCSGCGTDVSTTRDESKESYCRDCLGMDTESVRRRQDEELDKLRMKHGDMVELM